MATYKHMFYLYLSETLSRTQTHSASTRAHPPLHSLPFIKMTVLQDVLVHVRT